jgi:hypothetical protein
MTAARPDDVLVEGKRYKITYRDALEAGQAKTLTGKFVRYIEGEDLCIFYEDNWVHVPKAIVWSTEMLAVENLPSEEV